jgi:hypothetical protein
MKNIVLVLGAVGAALLYARHAAAAGAGPSGATGMSPLSGLSRAQPQTVGATLPQVAMSAAGMATLPGEALSGAPALAAHGQVYDMSVVGSAVGGNSPISYAPPPVDGSGGWLVQSSGPNSNNAVGTGAVPANWQTIWKP